MLRFCEELLLLLLNEERGDLSSIPQRSLECALAGATLMDLALENKIDTDLATLTLVETSPTMTGDSLIDGALKIIAESDQDRNTKEWIDFFSRPKYSNQLQTNALDRLIDRGILERDSSHYLWLSSLVSRSRRYGNVDGASGIEVRVRIMKTLYSDDIPESRDIMLISLANSCQLFSRILTRNELQEIQPRIDLISRLDLIGRSVSEAIRDITPDLASLPLNFTSIKERPRIKAAQPPVPGIPLAGNVPQFLGDLRKNFSEQYLKLGPVYRMRTPGLNVTVLAGIEANMFIQRKGKDYLRSSTYRPLAEFFGAENVLPAMDGPNHFRMRKVLRPGYSLSHLLKRLPYFIESNEKLLGELPLRQTFSVTKVFSRLIVKQLATINANTPESPYFDDAIFSLDRVIATIVAKMYPRFMLYTPRARRSRRGLRSLHEQLLKTHAPQLRKEEIEKHGPNTIDDLIEAHLADPQFLSESDLIMGFVGPFLAGAHTSSNTLAFALYQLFKSPNLYERAQVEADDLFSNGVPTAKQVRNLDVIDRIVKESLRLCPPAMAMPRLTINSFKLGRHVVPSGSSLLLVPIVTHFLEDFFPSPWKFDIDRFSKPRNEHNKVPFTYVPFGLGAHRCLGSRLAEAQIGVSLAHLLHRFELAMDPPGYKLALKFFPMAGPKRNFKFRIMSHRNPSPVN